MTIPILKLWQKVVYDVTNIEQHELIGFNADRPLADLISQRTNSLAVVDGMINRYFEDFAAARTIGNVYQARFVFKAKRGNAFRASHPESEFFKKPEPVTQFQCEQTSFIN